MPTASSTDFDFGEFHLSVVTSRASALFHAVDQLSGWSPYTHSQYRAWAPPGTYSEDEQILDGYLARQVKLRSRLGWGRGLERALYVPGEPEEALRAAVRSGDLTAADAREEGAILRAWQPALSPHLVASDARLQELRDLLREEAPAFTRLLSKWARLVGAAPKRLSVVVVPSPGDGAGGGGANGDAPVIELPAHGDVRLELQVIAHEAVHALLKPRAAELDAAATRCGGGLDSEAVNEALAYATAPGGFAYGPKNEAGDRLAAMLAHDDPHSRYAAFHRLALGIREPLWTALNRDTLSEGAFSDVLRAVCSEWLREKGSETPAGG